MGKLVHTVGSYANNPYEIERLGVRIHCLEELCYLLCENVYLLDEEVVSRELADWLDRECDLKPLASGLIPLILGKHAPGTLVGKIFQFAPFLDEEKRKETEKLYREGADINDFEKRKRYASYLIQKNRFSRALEEYDLLLEDYAGTSEEAVLLHNKAVALAGLFDFGRAEYYFFQALQKEPDNVQFEEHYLVAVRMGRTSEEYREFLEVHPEWHGTANKLERKWENLESAYVPRQVRQNEREETLRALRQRYREMVKK